MFRGSAGRWFSASIGAFPVQRNRLDRAALETASTLLQRGEPLLVFPEGTRCSGPTVGEVHNGCAYLATTTGTRVIPIGLAGTEEAMPPGARIPRRRRIVISIGEPIEPPIDAGNANPVGAPVEPARAEPDAERVASRTLRRALSAASGRRCSASSTSRATPWGLSRSDAGPPHPARVEAGSDRGCPVLDSAQRGDRVEAAGIPG